MSAIEASYSAYRAPPTIQKDNNIVTLIRVDQTELTPPARPSVEISISSGIPGYKTTVDRVNYLLSDLQEYNGRAFLLSRIDWAEVERLAGAERANENKKILTANLQIYQNEIGKRLDASAIVVLRPESSPSSLGAEIPGYISVSEFSFSEKGSLYKISLGEDGSLNGTKDDQPWKRWGGISDFYRRINSVDALGTLLTGFDARTTDNLLKVSV